jgi:hypothetical protein
MIIGSSLEYLQDLKDRPPDKTPTLKRVRQSRNYQVWRVSHPFRDGIAIRLIVWFPPDEQPITFVGPDAAWGFGAPPLRVREEAQPATARRRTAQRHYRNVGLGVAPRKVRWAERCTMRTAQRLFRVPRFPRSLIDSRPVGG